MNEAGSCKEMTNEEYKEEIRAILDRMLNHINDGYLLKYWFIYLKEKEKMHP